MNSNAHERKTQAIGGNGSAGLKTNQSGWSCSVKLFDTITLKEPAEYFVRGQLIFKNNDASGVFEPTRDSGGDDFLIASEMVSADERGIIPIRILTLKENVHVKKGREIGMFTKYPADAKVVKMNQMTCETKSRWKKLECKFDEHIQHLGINTMERKRILELLREFSDIFSIGRDDIGLTDLYS